jgi:hypothetical protein
LFIATKFADCLLCSDYLFGNFASGDAPGTAHSSLLRQMPADQDRGQLVHYPLFLLIQAFRPILIVIALIGNGVIAIGLFGGAMGGGIHFREIQDVIDDSDLGHDRAPVGFTVV